MITRWQKLRDILIPDILGDLGYLNSNHLFFGLLKEDDPSSVTPNILILGIPKNSILIHADHDLTQPSFLVDDGAMRKRCDYILLTRVNEKNVAICIELKSTSYKNQEVKNQLLGADCLLEFLAAVAKRFKGTSFSFDPSQIERRYVLIYVPDRPTKFTNNMPQPRVGNNNPSQFFSYPAITAGKDVPKRLNYTALVRV